MTLGLLATGFIAGSEVPVGLKDTYRKQKISGNCVINKICKPLGNFKVGHDEQLMNECIQTVFPY